MRTLHSATIPRDAGFRITYHDDGTLEICVNDSGRRAILSQWSDDPPAPESIGELLQTFTFSRSFEDLPRQARQVIGHLAAHGGRVSVESIAPEVWGESPKQATLQQTVWRINRRLHKTSFRLGTEGGELFAVFSKK